MTIDNYFKLTCKLFHNFIEDQYCTSSNQYQHVTIHDTPTSYQQQVYLLTDTDKILLFTFNITPIEGQGRLNLINIIKKVNEGEGIESNSVENILIDWSKDALTFPIDELNLSQDLLNSFNLKLRPHISNERYKNIIDQYSNKNANSDSNVLHHQLSRSPQNQPDEFLPASIPPMPSLSLSSVEAPAASSSSRPSDMPGFDDEYEVNVPSRQPPTNAFPSIGDRDLNPPGLPRHPDLNPYLDPLRVGGSSNNPGEGGMHPTANHPLFGGPPGSGNTSRLGVPPGARFDDPYGEDNLDALGSGLPGNLRLGSNHSSGGSGFPGFGGPSGGGGFQF
ncbi:PI31 proteasome regulator-domain-containing protein [Scheffersomyces coipomensis]|uniref:PI31 proteasome regulator-domain-containing protein n=1 Tax=Scheffersomyces coipomensis TaxID=1788519 RepID=UPI00315CB293